MSLITEQAGGDTGTISSQPQAEGHFCPSWEPTGIRAQEPGLQTPAARLTHERQSCLPRQGPLPFSREGSVSPVLIILS